MSDQSTTNTTPARGRIYPPGYGPVEPVANYRPWDIDPEFQATHALVRDNTMVDIYRLWILWSLARRATGAAVLEVGSWRGGSGALIATAVLRAAADDSAASSARGLPRVYLADTFSGVVKAGARDTYYKGGEHANTSTDIVREFLDGMSLDWVTLLAGTFPDETGSEVDQERFAFCHIDVDVYQSARDVFDWVWPRMITGGVVVFDDYGFYGCEGVTACVNEIMAQVPSAPVIPNLSGQAIVVRTEG